MCLSTSKTKSGSITVFNDITERPSPYSAVSIGCIRWGMIFFDHDKLYFKIDQCMVNEYISES